ncbi:glycine cleavage system aminomethyltransferase GcvT [Croceicoccus sp. BE223]|uniref:glycine cleavage system aminomethyltransferase GcvT n=1 Tax=Croceicoccus sp. BE223 TaxID=2817716 RepID=UPI00285A383C|nr:glycine cleavage system aminomethyltransferase GcvT [Croceicoccus sp. BE223]MDR7104022.1 aminomethyltransferase [Croceicoccus sp. BE223]
MSDTDHPEFEDDAPARLPLDAWHRARGARMVPFAGYDMPIQYPGQLGGIIAEHTWTRENAGLFDVSHMGQLLVSGEGAAEALEALMPGDFSALKPGRIRYSLLLDEHGGILDDLMVTNVTPPGAAEATFYLVVNGATKWDDIGHLREFLPDEITLTHLDDQALLALQGPKAAEALDRVVPGAAADLVFMQATSREWQGVTLGIARSGYTGEDGFELSVPMDNAAALADALCALDIVRPIGLGARDSLRLEAGLPLYGHDITTDTDPVSADLGFAISKRRREEGGFPGAEAILSRLAGGAATKRIGLAIEGRMAAREGAAIFAGDEQVGAVTSGGFVPTVGAPIAMGYVEIEHAAPGTRLTIEVRGRMLDATVAPMPFVAHRYHRQTPAKQQKV